MPLPLLSFTSSLNGVSAWFRSEVNHPAAALSNSAVLLCGYKPACPAESSDHLLRTLNTDYVFILGLHKK